MILVLLLLILRHRGSHVAAIQRKNLFTTALYYFCNDKLCTQSHQYSPYLLFFLGSLIAHIVLKGSHFAVVSLENVCER